MPRIQEYEDTDLQVLDSFQPQDHLHPDFWDRMGHLDTGVRDDLMEIARDFWDSVKIDAPILDVLFTGSLANLNYSAYSDIDLHILVDLSQVSGSMDLIKDYLQTKKNLWNKKHDINIKGFPVEIYTQDIQEPAVSTGIYSVLNDTWVVKPTAGVFHPDMPEVKTKTEALMAEIDAIISRGGPEDVDDFMAKLKRMRAAGLQSGGEASPENLAFKAIRRNGYLQKLSDFESQSYDLSKSIPKSE